MHSGDTIAAISSAVGPAARMIVRVSGAAAWSLAGGLCPGVPLAASQACSARMHLRGMSVRITVYAFRSPHSYTGEDLVEFHLPGNPLLAKIVLEELNARGARSAEAGEFTARAYFQGRMDLTEAEGVAATIGAHSAQELRAARQLLSGELARRLRPVMDLVAQTLALIEVGIDFSEEDVSFLSADEVTARIDEADRLLREVVEQSGQFEKLTHEARGVLVGRPNAGKSTLLNALAGWERAVVSPVAGTTRDAVSVEVPLARGMLRLVDVAGIAEEHVAHQIDAQAEIERQMLGRAMGEMARADLVIRVHDASSGEPPMTLARDPDLSVWTKSDLGGRESLAAIENGLFVSARTGENLEALRQRLDELVYGSESAGATLALNARHRSAIAEARASLARGKEQLAAGSEFVALELREALDALGRILGSVSPDDLLGKIFSSFCIGK